MGKEKETKATLPTTLEEALLLIKNQEEAISELQKIVDEQSKEIEKLEAKPSAVSSPKVVVGKKTYTVVCGTRANGKNLTSAEVAEDTELCKKLLEIEGQTILVEE